MTPKEELESPSLVRKVPTEEVAKVVPENAAELENKKDSRKSKPVKGRTILPKKEAVVKEEVVYGQLAEGYPADTATRSGQ